MWVGSTADSFTEQKFKGRVRFLSVCFAMVFGLIILRLFYLQVIKGDDFAQVSESNRTKTIFLSAPRGNFFDQNGKILVTNRPSWSLMYSPSERSGLTKDRVEKRLAPFLDPFPSRWKKRLRRAFKTKQLVRLVEDVPSPIAFGMREMGQLLPGLRMEMEFRRDYPNGVHAAQLVGYLGEIDEKELKDENWLARKPGDLIGKMGLEKKLDAQLRGQDGGMLIEIDSIGRLKRVIRELPYNRGKSILLTLDSNVQKVAREELAKTKTGRGAVVAIEPKTGAIRCWTSTPLFDPSTSLAKDVLDPDLPFFDRVYKGAYPPGSIYKIITALAGLETKNIKLRDKIICKGFVLLKDRRLKQRKYRCWKRHGEVTFWTALSESCDSYFYLLSQKMGSQAIYEMSRLFGLGATVQDTLSNENPGNIPNASWKRKQGLGGWATGDSYNMSIGQGYVTSTPLQMAVMMMGLVSRGTIYQPYVVRQIIDEDGVIQFDAKPKVLHEFSLEEKNWDLVLGATQLVVEKGTGRASRVRRLVVRGKTGTAQNPHGDDHAWFLASAGYPGEEDSIVVCVFVENGGNGGSAAAPIARKIIQTILPPKERKLAA